MDGDVLPENAVGACFEIAGYTLEREVLRGVPQNCMGMHAASRAETAVPVNHRVRADLRTSADFNIRLNDGPWPDANIGTYLRPGVDKCS
jgi:hypothetical protein